MFVEELIDEAFLESKTIEYIMNFKHRLFF